MTSRYRHSRSGRLALGCSSLVTLMVLGLTSWSGCQKSESTPSAKPDATPSAPGATPSGLESAVGQPATAQQPPAATAPGLPSAVTGAAPPVQETLPPIAGAQQITARSVLEAMVAAYKKADSYADEGQVVIGGQMEGKPLDEKTPCSVAFTRPNKVRLQVDSGEVVCDGQYLWGWTRMLPNQILRRPAPPTLTIAELYPDHVLGSSMIEAPTQAFSWVPLPVVLLLGNDPLKTILHQAKEPVVLPSAKLDQLDCYRIQIERPEGTAVLWIDQNGHLLRRAEFPTQIFQAEAAAQRLENMSITGEYANAQINTAIDPKAFQVETPEGVQIGEDLTPPDVRLLGKPAPKFEFAGMDGKPVTLESLAGKVAVIDFWATWCMPCRQSMPELAKVYEQYKANDKVVFLLVSIDEEKVDDKTLGVVLTDWGVKNLPIYRDRQRKVIDGLGIPAVPATVMVGPNGAIQDVSGGGQPGFGQELQDKIEALLAGQDVFPKMLAGFEQGKQQFAAIRDQSVAKDTYVMPTFTQQEVPRAEILARTEPTTLRMSRLWDVTQLKAPGNILVLQRPDGTPRIFVLNNLNSIAELGTDGQVIANPAVATQTGDPLMFLRAAAAPDGRLWFVGSALGAQHLYLTDEKFALLVQYPKDDSAGRHAGFGDVQLADLNGDGKLEMAAGYLGVVGVQGVSLEGERIWANKSLANVFRLVVLAAGADKRRNLMCMNFQPDGGTLMVLDSEGNRQEDIVVKGRAIGWLAAGDLDGDGQPEICGLSPTETGVVVAFGIGRQGEELWNYPLPKGVHQQQIEPVISGDLSGGGTGHWIVAAADGTIHILGADGKLFDKFAYGAELTGIAAAHWDDKRVLLVATTQGIEAWQVVK